ncbi:MAG: S41 family peptidase [Caldilineaceae bacterium]|nr:S41 family peptidase [Caldilineaceae bacterium]
MGICLLVGLGFGAGAIYGTSTALADNAEQPAEFQVFWQAWTIVQRHFVDRDALDPVKLTHGAIRGMVNALGDDGHTAFLTPEEVTLQQSSIAGKFSGIGAQLGTKDGMPMIVAPFDGSPAALAGVKAGDLILAVDGEDVTRLPINEIVSRVRGDEGSTVTLTLFRADEQTSVEIAIVRGEIKVSAVSWGMIPHSDIAYLRLRQFSASATNEIVEALHEIEDAGAAGVVLDLRNNPGGLLVQAIGVTSQFLKDGNVLQEEDANGRIRAYAVQRGGVATDIPLVVLINPGTASSAEILSGAIQDYERGTLVGETTFGTGTVLQPYSLEDGSALMLGTRQWLTAEGRLIRKQGIQPDIEVILPVGTELLSPDAIKEMTAEEIWASDDLQFQKALEILTAQEK